MDRPKHTSHHAENRARQRYVSQAAIDATMRFGTRTRSHDCDKVVLDPFGVRRARAYGLDLEKWVWTTVILSATGVVVTVYRIQGRGRLKHREKAVGAPKEDE